MNTISKNGAVTSFVSFTALSAYVIIYVGKDRKYRPWTGVGLPATEATKDNANKTTEVRIIPVKT